MLIIFRMLRALRRPRPKPTLTDLNPKYPQGGFLLFPNEPFRLGSDLSSDSLKLKELRIRERSDWGEISVEEKTQLYLGYYDQSVTDHCRPSDVRRGLLGLGLIFASLVMLLRTDYDVSTLHILTSGNDPISLCPN